MAPFDLVAILGVTGSYLVYLGIGFGFGFILESSGFGDSRKLAAQFYFRELRVLKVMFTAIVVAMLLVFWASALAQNTSSIATTMAVNITFSTRSSRK